MNSVVFKIEKFVQEILDQIAIGQYPVVSIPSARNWSETELSGSTNALTLTSNSTTKNFVVRSYERKNGRYSFAVLCRLLSTVYRLLKTNSKSTKRDIYYGDVKFYQYQRNVDKAVDEIIALLDVPRYQLNIVSVAKGLIAGHVRFRDASGMLVDCNRAKQGTLIPNNIESIQDIWTDAQFLLIVEDDATFEKLVQSDCLQRWPPMILVTGKGMPDVSTRLLVRRIWEKYPRMKLFGLFDGDPSGIQIYLVYLCGSLELLSMNSILNLPSLQWIGILPTDIQRLKLPERVLQPLSDYDRNFVVHLKKRQFLVKNLPHVKAELEHLQQLDKKAEIQSLTAISDGFLEKVFLPSKFQLLSLYD